MGIPRDARETGPNIPFGSAMAAHQGARSRQRDGNTRLAEGHRHKLAGRRTTGDSSFRSNRLEQQGKAGNALFVREEEITRPGRKTAAASAGESRRAFP